MAEWADHAEVGAIQGGVVERGGQQNEVELLGLSQGGEIKRNMAID
jgi:hypothetical protein